MDEDEMEEKSQKTATRGGRSVEDENGSYLSQNMEDESMNGYDFDENNPSNFDENEDESRVFNKSNVFFNKIVYLDQR
jgi:hypothetical protein